MKKPQGTSIKRKGKKSLTYQPVTTRLGTKNSLQMIIHGRKET